MVQPDHRGLVHGLGADHEVLLELLEVVHRVPRPKVRVKVDVGVGVRILQRIETKSGLCSKFFNFLYTFHVTRLLTLHDLLAIGARQPGELNYRSPLAVAYPTH